MIPGTGRARLSWGLGVCEECVEGWPEEKFFLSSAQQNSVRMLDTSVFDLAQARGLTLGKLRLPALNRWSRHSLFCGIPQPALAAAFRCVADDKIVAPSFFFAAIMLKPARILTFKCAKCAKAVQVFLQKVSACSHIQPYQGICVCGEVKRHATGHQAAVVSYLASTGEDWMHRH